MNIIAPLFLIFAAVGLFYGYTDPHYRGENVPSNIVRLQKEISQYEEALNNSNNFITERNKLVEKNNNISTNDTERLKKLLPDHIDNVKLIIDIDGIASKYGLNIRNMDISDSAVTQGKGVLGPDNNPYGSLTMKFNVIAPYDKFRLFIKDLEESLRIIDITGISFTSSDTGYYDYEVAFKTYWLK